MHAEGLPQEAIDTFAHYYKQLVAGATGLIAEDEISPVAGLPDAEALPANLEELGNAALKATVLIKLNGGLGTSMGLESAKTLLKVKKELTFLDIIARQALHSAVPLVLMNSFNTRADSLARLADYPKLRGDIPLDFLQHKVPKVRQSDAAPASFPGDPELSWAPPGHGDIYTALVTSGMLQTLLAAGKQYAFVSNADNLGAVIDRRILGYFVAEDLPFMMEVADRTAADRKGGHLAQLRDGQLILRESAQVRPEDEAAFQDISRHRYFNTNNLWLNLVALQKKIDQNKGILGLPMIRNAKSVNPRDPDSTPVYQIETAMGSAIAVFEGSGALRVPRSRFAPVKTTADLLAVRSDHYLLDDDYRIVTNPRRELPAIVITLDPQFYRLIDDLEARFPHGAPSLVACRTLKIEGDIVFGHDVTLRGDVHLSNERATPRHISDGEIIGEPDQAPAA